MRSVIVAWDPLSEHFTALGTNPDHQIRINAPRRDAELPPTGFSPTELLLAGAGACAAWDVIGIMRKKRRPLTGLSVTVEGRQNERPPHQYEHVRLHFRVSGDALDIDDLRRALQLSLDRYCSVLATIRPGTQIEQTIEIVDDPVMEESGTAAAR